jgi:hypothetical protein
VLWLSVPVPVNVVLLTNETSKMPPMTKTRKQPAVRLSLSNAS